MRRPLLALALFALACARPTADVAVAPEPLVGFGYSAPAQYYEWIAQVQTCAQQIAALDSVRAEQTGEPRAFAIDHLIRDIGELHFFAIPTERADGTFTCPQGFQCWGVAFEDNVIYLSAQRVMDPVTVKHEVLHIVVASDGEASVPYHGVPWGLCEYN